MPRPDTLSDSSLARELVCLCCRQPDDATAQRVRDLAAMPVHWEAVLELADLHGVRPLVAARLLMMAPHSPDRIVNELRRTVMEQTAFNAGAIGGLRLVMELLDAHGIAAAAYKGPTFAAAAYHHIGMRSFDDLDILVAPEAIQAARRCLTGHGFTLMRSDFDSVCPSAGSEEKFIPPGRGHVAVEVQSRPWKWPLALRLDTRDLLGRRHSIDIAGQPIPTLVSEDLVLVLAVHGLFHGWTHLRYVCDIDAAAALKPDWQVVIEHARDARAARILAVGLLLANNVLGTESGAALVWARHDRTAVTLARQIHTRLFVPPSSFLVHPWKDLIRCRSREYTSDKLRYCLRTVASERVIAPIDWIRRAYAQRRPARARASGEARP